MKTVANLLEAQQLAMRHGATLSIGAQVFNTGRAQSLPAPPKPVAPLPPAPKPVLVEEPPEPASITREELAAIVASRDAFWMAEMQRLAQTLANTFASMQQQPAPHGWRFKANYMRGDRIDFIDAIPRDLQEEKNE